MSETKVTPERIQHLLETAEYQTSTVFGKCTVMVAKLENGFVIVESSACVDPENYDEELGCELCFKKITDKLWELEGYALQKSLFENGVSHEKNSCI